MMLHHINLLGVLLIVWGWLCVTVGLAWLALAAGAVALMSPTDSEGAAVAAEAVAIAFTLLAAVLTSWGALNVWTGVAARRHRRWARLTGLAVAVLNLFFIPFGAVLGVYALWVLLHDQVRRVFEPTGPESA